MLRNELAFFKDRPWVYYIAAVANVVLRFSWVFYLAPRPATGVQSYTIALIEASRRIMWNTFRVEAEHIGNRDGYRVTRDVPLPYVSSASPEASGHGADENDDEDDSLEGATSLRARFFRSAHSLHRSLVDNLAPVIDTIFSPTVLALGRREDPAARERREVEHQQRRRRRTEDNSSDEEEERDGHGGAQPTDGNTTDDDADGADRLREHEKRQRVRQSELDRRRRRRKSIFLNSGDDESSSPDTSTETESRSGRARRERVNRRTGSRAGSPLPGQGDDDNSDRHERGDADIGEESLAAPKEDHDVDSDAATTPSPGPTAEHLDETSGDAALQREVAEAERMTEMAESGGA